MVVFNKKYLYSGATLFNEYCSSYSVFSQFSATWTIQLSFAISIQHSWGVAILRKQTLQSCLAPCLWLSCPGEQRQLHQTDPWQKTMIEFFIKTTKQMKPASAVLVKNATYSTAHTPHLADVLLLGAEPGNYKLWARFYRVVFFTGTPLKVLSVRLHSKSIKKFLSVRIYLPAGS